ncbi:MAG: iron-containing alcohol dehydrogenase family protein [Anaerostipes sp.]|mgnify:FL=1|uniref:iron-containing alcohol dehydrogenase family protein n=1 Tax=Anaerostipes sp. 992a TaxID=1261637 RepID=UPI0009534CEC|nr:iron-containing alcohol dehydrogenase family protein [Anaerostipes sp. 992a]MCI5951810.1 iron-containing alcohol dehydrogenase family protein [Anaerostipes sp.]MDD5969126.1 iron-containing alcohol dehydrogenase family protein [Anaerostipes sp.]OLR60953.1 hypothetical protein BHF69_12015 [Anaerostipes sp. 992a]
MNFYMPTRIFAEKGSVRKNKEQLQKLGSCPLIVTGRHSSKINGSLKDVEDSLKELSMEYYIFDEIEENPSVETCERAAAYALEKGCDMVIGVGGGSPLDASKAIALLMKNPDKDGEIFYKAEELPWVPVAAVPTTAGTGSEATPYAILTVHKWKTKKSISHRIFPDVAFVDATYLTYTSKRVLISTAVDALAHLVEGRINVKSNAYNQMLSEYGMQLWGQAKEALRKEQPSQEEYELLMEASTIAGMTISHTGTSLPHGMSYYLTYEQGISHGKAVAIFLAAYMKESQDEELINKITSRLGFADMDEMAAFLREVLGEVTISIADVERYAKELSSDAKRLSSTPYKVTEETLLRMYEASVTIKE